MKKSFIDKLINKEDIVKKLISINLEKKTVDDINLVIRAMNKVSDSGITITKQSFLEECIKDGIETTKEYLKEYLEQTGTKIEDLLNDNEVEAKEDVYDTIVVPAQQDGFEKVFLGENQWYYIRIDKKRLKKIKWIAVYVGAPVSAITHYAKVKGEPELDENEGKYIIKFDGEPIQLTHKIILGDINSMYVRSNKYITKQQLLEAREYKDIIKFNEMNR